MDVERSVEGSEKLVGCMFGVTFCTPPEGPNLHTMLTYAQMGRDMKVEGSMWCKIERDQRRMRGIDRQIIKDSTTRPGVSRSKCTAQLCSHVLHQMSPIPDYLANDYQYTGSLFLQNSSDIAPM
jgi:hypothetical protein